MNFRKTVSVSIATMAVLAAGLVACSSDQESPTDAASKTASPIVQQAGVMRFRSEAIGNVTRVALLDEAGNGIGTLELTTDAPHRVRAKQSVRGRSFEASWSDDGLTFTPDGKRPVTVDARGARGEEAERALLDATNDLSIALGVARDVGAFSLVTNDTAPTVRPLILGTGEDDRDRFTGNNWAWGTGSSSWTSAYGASQNSAYSGCAAVYPGGGCATFQGATMSTSCSTGSYYTSCTTTVTVGACAGTGTCPH